MSAVQPVAVYALKVPSDGALVPAVPDAAAMFRVSMAAIDPDETPNFEDNNTRRSRATLKIIRPPPGLDLDEDSEDDYEDDDDEDSEDDEELNGGPSDKEKARKLKQAAYKKEMEEAMEEDDDSDEGEEFDLKAAISKLVKGKAPATDDDDEDDESDEGLELDEMVVCTLDPERNYQQPLDITVGEGERVFFKVTGTHTIYLTGNYVMPLEEGRPPFDEDEDENEGDDYDLSPDEDELDLDEIMMGEDDESDDLDDLENPRITEVDSDEEEAPKLVDAKGKKKRAADDAALEDLIAKDSKAKSAANGESKKQQKKLKKNNGEASAVEAKPEPKEAKKVQFAKNLEQGPTPSKDKKPAEKNEKTEKTTGTLGVKEVKGVTVDDKKLGKGSAASSGNTVAMRYIGKLENGKVFDSNKKGKPFSFKLGKGEVIKGWDIGVAGMAVGGERRITIPPHLAYGKKALPGIPGNSKLIFDVKLLEIK